MDYNMLPLGKKIKVKRVIDGLTQQELAANLGIAQSNLARWEAGTKPIPKNRLTAIYTYLEKNKG